MKYHSYLILLFATLTEFNINYIFGADISPSLDQQNHSPSTVFHNKEYQTTLVSKNMNNREASSIRAALNNIPLAKRKDIENHCLCFVSDKLSARQIIDLIKLFRDIPDGQFRNVSIAAKAMLHNHKNPNLPFYIIKAVSNVDYERLEYWLRGGTRLILSEIRAKMLMYSRVELVSYMNIFFTKLDKMPSVYPH